MKKIFMLAVAFAAVSMVACGGNNEKKANEGEQVETANVEVVEENACCGECCGEEKACCGECCGEEKACCGECCQAEVEVEVAE